MSLPSLVLFDCDGVLVDSERLTHCVLREMIAEFGVSLTLEQTLDHFMGTSTEKELEVLASLIGHAVPADFGDRFNARSFEAFTSSLEPVPGVPQLLASLQLPYCVASNGSRKKMHFTLGHTGLLPFFEGRLFSAQDVKTPKPAPDLFLHAAASLGVSAAGCLVVEDSVSGVTAARLAGMRVFGFAAMGQRENLSQAGAHLVFGDMADLPSIIEAYSDAEPFCPTLTPP
jgi:HAD superfamily hydrolase (TIGR01509 family)